MENMLAFELTRILPALLAGIGVILLLYSTTRRISGKSKLKQSQAANMIPSVRQQQDIKCDLQRLLVDLQDLARQINAHIDTRFCKLEVLIKQADEKIKRLEQLANSQNKIVGGSNDNVSNVSLDENESGKFEETNQESLSSAQRPEDRPERIDPERALIYKLADRGKSIVEIARELNKNTGEIELILSLRRSERQARGEHQIDFRIED